MKFPMERKKAHVIPIHKKVIHNASETTDLSLCSRSAGRSLCKELYKVFNENDLLSPNHSVFRPGDYCIDQLLSITHEIYQSFDNDPEVRGVFLDMPLIKFGMKD